LECFNCPKAEKLFDQLIWLETCGNHLESNAYQHCAKVEVEAFAMHACGCSSKDKHKTPVLLRTTKFTKRILEAKE
jgi:hypothetical protein